MSRKFSQDFVSKVAEANNLVDIIGRYTQLKSSGGGFMGRCPFPDHQEKTPSFSVSEVKQVYHCFGCQKKGNIYTFLQTYSGMSFPEAIEYLADNANIPLPVEMSQNLDEEQKNHQHKKRLSEANGLALQYFMQKLQELPEDHQVKKYLEERFLSPEIVQEFSIGYATDSWDGLLQFLNSKGFENSILEEVKLVRPKSSGGHYDLFRHRLIFPIHNLKADVVGFGGRVLSSQDQPKYLNSPESPIFHKGKILFNQHRASKFIRSEDSVVVVEGYMDAVALWRAGIRNVVATLGTALTSDHARALFRLTRNVTVLFDGDSAGIEAAQRSLPILLSGNLHPKGVILPDESDPDDYLNEKGPDALKKAVQSPEDLMMLLFRRNWAALSQRGPQGKVSAIDGVLPLLKAVPDPRLKELYVQEIAKSLQVSPSMLKDGFQPKPKSNDFSAQFSTQMQKKEQSNSVPGSLSQAEEKSYQIKGALKAEKILLKFAFSKDVFLRTIIEKNVIEEFITPPAKTLLSDLANQYRQNPERFDTYLSSFMDLVDLPEVLMEDQNPMDFESQKKLMSDCVKKLKEESIVRKMTEISKRLSLTTLSTEEKESDLRELHNLQRLKVSLKSSL